MSGFSKMKEIIATQRGWGTDTFKGVFYHGKQIASAEDIEALGSESEYNQFIQDRIAELLGQGITRQGGNY